MVTGIAPFADPHERTQFDHFLRDQLDHKSLTGLTIKVMHRPGNDTAPFEKSRFRMALARFIEGKLGPVGELPISRA